MTSMVTPGVNAVMPLGGRARTAAPVEPRVSEANPQRKHAEQRPREDGECYCHRYHQSPRSEKPREYSETAERVERPKKHQQVQPDDAKRVQRRNGDRRDSRNEAPHQLVIEPELAEWRERRSDTGSTHPVVQRPGQREHG